VADVRATGVRVRLESAEHAATVSVAAREPGLAADPAVDPEGNELVIVATGR
jgi:hypothetical protein